MATRLEMLRACRELAEAAPAAPGSPAVGYADLADVMLMVQDGAITHADAVEILTELAGGPIDG